MEPLVWVIMIIAGIGALIAGIAGIAVFAMFWWIAIPVVCAMVLGPLGFFFGLGLVVIIGLIILAVKNG